MEGNVRKKILTFAGVFALFCGLSLVAFTPPASASISVPTCPATTLSRTGAQTSQLKADMNNDTWDLTGATWTDANIYGAVRSDTDAGTNCVKGGDIDGNIQPQWTRDCWYNGDDPTECAASNAGDGITLRPDQSGDTVVIKDITVSDYEDAFDLQANEAGASAYLDHVKAEDIGDDCFENEGSASDPDVPVSHLYIKDSFFDNCFTGFGWRPDSNNSNAEGANSNESFTVEDSLIHLGLHALGSGFCDSSKISSGRCYSVSTSVSDSGMVGLYGLWKWSTDAPVSSNITLRNVVIKIDGQSYSSCKPWDWPTGATYDNVTVVYVGPGSYNSLCSGSQYALPSGVTLTTDTSVWDDAVAAWEDGGTPPPPTNAAPTVDAGSAQTVDLPGTASLDGTVSDDGLPAGSSLSVTWSKVSGPGQAGFGDSSAIDTTVAFTEPGTYVLELTANDGAATGSDQVTVVANPEPVNEAPEVSAGPDQTVTLPDTVALDGFADDDGLPDGTLTTTWSKVSGPGVVVFDDDTATDTTASFSTAGTYVLLLTASDGDRSSTDAVTITVNPAPVSNQAPVVNAGEDTAVSVGGGLNLDGTVTDDGLPTSSTLTSTWTKFSGPGTANFTDASDPGTRVTFTLPGSYWLQLTATDGELTSSDFVYVDVQNEDPSVDAGVDESVTLPDSLTLDGWVADETPETLTTLWSKTSGPGTVTFDDPTDAHTTATFSEAGTYVLKLEAYDNMGGYAYDELTVTVNPENTPPTVTIPQSTYITTVGDYVFVDGSVNDAECGPNLSECAELDGVDKGWSVVSGDPTAIDMNDWDDAATSMTAFEPGTYVLRLSATDGEYTVHKDMTLVVTEPAADVTYVGSSYEYNESDSVTVDLPSGVQPGDVVVFQASQNQGHNATFATPTGLTHLGTSTDGSSLSSEIYTYTVPTTGALTSVTFDANDGDVYESQVTAVAYSGVESASLVTQAVDSGTDASHPVTGTTTADGWNLVMAVDRTYVSGGRPPSTWTPGTGLTERSDGGGHSTRNTKSSLSATASDTAGTVAAGSHTYGETASNATQYGITALVQLVPDSGSQQLLSQQSMSTKPVHGKGHLKKRK